MTDNFVQAECYLESGTSIKGDLGRPFNKKMKEIINEHRAELEAAGVCVQDYGTILEYTDRPFAGRDLTGRTQRIGFVDAKTRYWLIPTCHLEGCDNTYLKSINAKGIEAIDKLFENEWFKEHVTLMKYLGSSFKYRPLISPCIWSA
ncbi:hypothetical protein [Fibrobacter sp.]|uniref:hypothetical protein n=1 Tax=Fibrobacter sp. TaxID=35828 RepID=UPI0038697B65